MTTEEKELLDEKFKGLTVLMNAHFDNVDDRLKAIEEQTKKTNGRVNELEKKEITHFVDCPNVNKIRALEDNQLTSKAIKKWIVASIGVTTAVISLIFALIELYSKLPV